MREQLDYLRQVQRGIDYIEANLEADLELPQVSRKAGISHWHFQRIFKALTGETLKTYVRSRRLANSLNRLLLTKVRILDIALDAGFESQESFTRAFKSSFGMTPGAYRKLGDRSLFLTKVQFDGDYLTHINQNVSLAPELTHKPAMHLIGLRTMFFSSDSDKNNIAEKLPPLWGAFLSRIEEITQRTDQLCYGVVRQSAEDSEHLEYFAAVETEVDAPIPEGMASVEVAESTYAEFAHRGKADGLDHTVNYIYSTWLAQSGKRHTYRADLEIYGAEYHPTSEDSVLHYAIPIG